MMGRQRGRRRGSGRQAVLALVAVVLAAGAISGLLVATAGAAASCPSMNFDEFTPTTGDWSLGSNWSLGAPPSGTEVACWDASSTVTVSDSESADSIQADGDLDIVGGGTLTLTSASDPSVLGDLTLDGGGELDGAGQALTVSGTFTWGNSVTGTAMVNNTAAAPDDDLAISVGTLTMDDSST